MNDYGYSEFIYADGVTVRTEGKHQWITCQNFLSHGKVTFELGNAIGKGATASVRTARIVGMDFGRRPPSSKSLMTLPPLFAIKDIEVSRFRDTIDRSERAKQKIRREVSIMASLRHPSIITIFGALETGAHLYLVMELAEGGELFEKVSQEGTPNEDQLRYVVMQLVDALSHVHSKGIIHRDLKLENVLIDKEVDGHIGYYNVKIADFGLSIFVGDNPLGATSFVGTPQYWAPEVIKNATSRDFAHYGTEADVWSLGCLIFIMVALDYPFKDSNPASKGAFKFSSRFEHYDSSLRDLISRMLTVDASQRIKLKDVMQHPWMTAPRPIHSPAFFHLTQDGKVGPYLPVIVSPGSMLQSISKEPVFTNYHPRPPLSNPHAIVPAPSIKTASEASTDKCADLRNHPGKGVITTTTAFNRSLRRIPSNNSFENLGKYLNLTLAVKAGSLIEKMNDEVARCLKEITHTAPRDIILDLTDLRTIEKIEELSPGEPATPVMTDEEMTERGFEEQVLAKLIITMLRHLQWVCLSYRRDPNQEMCLDRTMKDLVHLVHDAHLVMSKLVSTYDIVAQNMPFVYEAVRNKILFLAVQRLVDTDEYMIENKVDTEKIRSQFSSVEADLDKFLFDIGSSKRQHDMMLAEEYQQQVKELVSAGDAEPIKLLQDKLKEGLTASIHCNTALDYLRKVRKYLRVIIRFWDTAIIHIEDIRRSHKWITQILQKTDDSNVSFCAEWMMESITRYDTCWRELGTVVKTFKEECIWLLPAVTRISDDLDSLKSSVSTLSLHLMTNT
eukprot:GHVH01005515.1.p1 GENE.GHVH01005515.1~~GHVH01005515.1.p1  ORF type:complete len:786 (-),score=104.28 GHVH01005515.1:1920-4277(-)